MGKSETSTMGGNQPKAEEHFPRRPAARSFFKFAATATVLLVVFTLTVGILSVADYQLVQKIAANPWSKAVGFVLGILGGPSAGLLWLGMLWDARIAKRTVWFIFLLVGSWLTALLYYWFPYRRHLAGFTNRG